MNEVETPARRSPTIRMPETRVITRWRETPRIEKTWKRPPWPLAATPGTPLTSSVRVDGAAAFSSERTTVEAIVTGAKASPPREAVTTMSS